MRNRSVKRSILRTLDIVGLAAAITAITMLVALIAGGKDAVTYNIASRTFVATLTVLMATNIIRYYTYLSEKKKESEENKE